MFVAVCFINGAKSFLMEPKGEGVRGGDSLNLFYCLILSGGGCSKPIPLLRVSPYLSAIFLFLFLLPFFNLPFSVFPLFLLQFSPSILFSSSVLEFLNNLWELGTEYC